MSSSLTPGLIPGKNKFQKTHFTPRVTAALFTIAKTWKPLKCPSTNEYINKMYSLEIYRYLYIETMKYYSAIKKG